MRFISKKLELPQENGKYILTEKAVEKIRKGNYLNVSFELVNGKRVEENCWLQVGIKHIIEEEEIYIVYTMPINLQGIDSFFANHKFRAHEYIETGCVGGKHAILGLIKEGVAIYFEPSWGGKTTGLLEKKGLIGDALYWIVQVGEEDYRGLFTFMIAEKDSDDRLIKKTPNQFYHSLYKTCN
jgi:hypothetical protein